MNGIRQQLLIAFALVLGCAQPLAAHSTYQHIAAYIPSHELDVSGTPGTLEERMRPPMTDARKYFTTLDLFAQTEPKSHGPVLLSPASWDDFAIFPNVLESIDRTKTIFGKAALAGMLVNAGGAVSAKELQHRQQIIKALLAQPELLQTIEQSLGKLKELEPFFLRFFSGQQSEREQVLSQYYKDRSDHPWFQGFNKQLDIWERDPNYYLGTGIADRIGTLLGFVGIVKTAQSLWGWARGGFNIKSAFYDSADQMGKAQRAAANWQLPTAALFGAYGLWKGFDNAENFSGNYSKLVNFPYTALIETPGKLKGLLVSNRILHEDLIQLAQGLETMRALNDQLIAAGVPQLIPQSYNFFMFCASPGKLSKDLKSLVDMLNTPTFKGKPSLFSHFGRLFAANFLIKKTKAEWGNIFKALGYLDAYASLARLVQEHENQRVKFCFVEYLDRSKPAIELKDFWYPVVGAHKAVANDLTFGEQEQNIILTGPFASGKSTVMRGIGVSVLMAQTLGIAPATSMRLTPFAMINTSMNISDSPAYDLSGLMAELKAAGSLLARVVRRGSNEFCLNIFDEIFRATNESDGELILNRFVKKMAVPHALNIFATHKQGDKIKGLEQEFAAQKLFTNYKVESPDGKVPDYKLKRGWTRQSLLHESTLQRFGI